MKIFELTIFWFTIAPSYYGLMYALGFILAYLIILKRKKIEKGLVDDLFLYVFAWVILGGRLWYILFYNLSSYLENPLHILRIWEWGMSFHGGMLWVILAVYLFHKIKKVSFLKVMDEIALTVPIWIWLGRVGNYINWELLWFAWYTGPLSINWRFPSPLLEAFLEWFITLVVLFMVSKKQKFAWQLWALFLILYWFFRLLVEVFVRTPDAHIGYIFWYFSMWAILSSAMIIVGWINYYILRKK
jgi:phosphatidylglycerol:prolipoprotein diacylglycerol transferase